MGARSWSSAAATTPSSSPQQQQTTTGPFFSTSSPNSSSGGKKRRPLVACDRHAFFRIPASTGKLVETPPQSVATAKVAAAAAAQRAERNLSVKRDLALNLPPSPALPDGEERPYGSSIRLRIRDHNQESEIYRECIRPPPNRTVHETQSFPHPFRCNSESILMTMDPPMKPKAPAPSSVHHPSTTTSSRLLLDIHGQPIVTRSKSMSTGSSLQQQPTPDSYMTVMVPPAPKTLEAAVKSYVRSLRERVQQQQQKPSIITGTGVDNAGYSSSSRRIHHHEEEPSSGGSRSKLANLPVVCCAASASPPPQQQMATDDTGT